MFFLSHRGSSRGRSFRQGIASGSPGMPGEVVRVPQEVTKAGTLDFSQLAMRRLLIQYLIREHKM